MKKIIRYGFCKKCGNCCRYERTVIENPTEETEEYYAKRAAQYRKSDNSLILFLYSKCPYLLDNNKCSIHDTDEYPTVCREYPINEKCLYIKDCGYYFEEELDGSK